MFESIMNLFKKLNKKEKKATVNSKEAAKERLHLVLMQDRANVSADFLELMKQEIIDVIKKYIDVDEGAIDVRLTNKENEDGTNGAPALYANIPIINIKHETKKAEKSVNDTKSEENKEQKNKKTEKSEETKKDNKKVEEKSNQKEDKDSKKEDIKKQNEEKDVVKEENKEQQNNDKDNKKIEDDKNKTNDDTKDEIKSEN
mgnify:CR=1 FL=1